MIHLGVCETHGLQPTVLVCHHLARRLPGPSALLHAVRRRKDDHYAKNWGWLCWLARRLPGTGTLVHSVRRRDDHCRATWLCMQCSNTYGETHTARIPRGGVCERCYPTPTTEWAPTPQRNQLNRLLQLSTLELRQEVEQRLMRDSLLEARNARAPAPEPRTERMNASGRRSERKADPVAEPTGADIRGEGDVEPQDRDTPAVASDAKPGRPFGRAEANVIVPDVIAQMAGRGWKVVLNADVVPKLRINARVAAYIPQPWFGFGRPSGLNRAGSGLNASLQETHWFISNVLERFDTIQRVSQAIVERQKNFFTHGEIAMKPLVLREIADELGLDESTISRVTTAKYMSTPFGTFELKYFFGTAVDAKGDPGD
jgi:DNA-directed RNA polymerase specialized sigma54-like protein